jgi:hypothetical protein
MDVKTNREVSKEISTTTGGGPRLWIVSYVILAFICLAVYFLLQFQVFGLLGTYRSFLQRLALAGLVVSFVFIATKTIKYCSQTIAHQKGKLQRHSPHQVYQFFDRCIYRH